MMIIFRQHIGFSHKLVTLAVLAAFNPVHAAEGDNISPATSLRGTASAGLAVAGGNSKDRALFGQYNGLRNQNEHLLLDADIVNQNDASGIRTTFQGSNFGLDDRELRFTQNKQGNWKYSAAYSELTRNDPRTINTGVQGIGTANLTVNGAAARTDVNLSTKRKNISLDAEKWLTSSIKFEASLKSEDKNGARLFGRGNTCGAYNVGRTSNFCAAATGGAILMLPEPIDSNIKQIDARLNFSGDKYLLSAAYYGSFYTNSNGSLNTTLAGNLWHPNGTTPIAADANLVDYMQRTMALPPDNQAHQLSLDGNYTITPATHVTFKYARTHATQNENFASAGLVNSPAGVNDLGGVVDTTLTQLGLTARPMAKLSLLANLRYEDKDDKTPLQRYSQILTAVVPTYTAYTNSTDPLKKLTGKLEASYQLPNNYRATLGADYETVNRGVFESTAKPGGLNMLREETKELGWRTELRHTMSETLNASISYLSSRRNGSSWLDATVVPVVALSDASAIALGGATSSSLMDRERDKLKLSADWSPSDKLTLQFMLEDGKDKYSEPHLATRDGAGLKDTGIRLYGIDASLTLSDIWKLTGYVSHGEQIQHINHSNGTAPNYRAELENTNTAIGIGVRGKPSGKLDFGGDLSYLNDKNHYGQLQAATTALPDVIFHQTTLKLFGKYALEKNADVRVDFIQQHTRLNEWTWENGGQSFRYSDNTTVSMKQSQNVAFIGATYIYKLK